LHATFYVLHPFLQVFLRPVDVAHLPGVAGPEVENVLARVVAVPWVAEPVVGVVAVVAV
jgi:hypothetical protein